MILKLPQLKFSYSNKLLDFLSYFFTILGSPGVVSRLEGWFRNRAGSVPNRPQLNERRRHRTQSEGEKDAAAKDPINS